jgi:hypothetical protein
MNKVDPAELFTKYPHIAKKITMLWGSSNCRELLLSLINDSRDGGRAGFSPEIARIIFALLDKHDEMYPQFNKSAHIEVPFGFTQKKVPAARAVKENNDGWGVIHYAIIIFILILGVSAYKGYLFYLEFTASQ